MRHFFRSSLLILPFVAMICPQVYAQSPQSLERSEEAFASENAILDTAIPFAIGAREARQALRGAFGWPSFQEGLVEGVYFRFDPDGYARFAPTPRLDVDVFEVICRPRTYACAARKDGMEVFLTERGQLQVKLAAALAGDNFFVSEGVSEIQVPERILQPLDVQLELLLGSGGDLVVRRGSTEAAKISLKGFGAVSAYLRWISARQDYAVLPRGWPVPNGDGARASTVTQAAAWNSPMPQPQVLSPGYGVAIAPATSAAPVTMHAQYPAASDLSVGQAAPIDAAALRAELEVLKQMLREGVAPLAIAQTAVKPQARSDDDMVVHLLTAIDGLQSQVAQLQTQSQGAIFGQDIGRASASTMETPMPQSAGLVGGGLPPLAAMPGAGDLGGGQSQLITGHVRTELPAPVNAASLAESGAALLQRQILAQTALTGAALHSWPAQEVTVPTGAETVAPASAEARAQDRSPEPIAVHSEVRKLEFLMSQLGLDMQTAVSVLQMSNQRSVAGAEVAAAVPDSLLRAQEGGGAQTTPVLYQNDLVDQILEELEAEMAQSAVGSQHSLTQDGAAHTVAESSAQSAAALRDYQLLSRYFGSAALPALKEMVDTGPGRLVP